MSGNEAPSAIFQEQHAQGKIKMHLSKTLQTTVLSFLCAFSALPAQATSQIDPKTYSMQDGPGGEYADQSYTGSHDPFGWLSGGEGELTDGIKGGHVVVPSDWAPYVLWDGYDGTSQVITFDLGANYAVSEIQASFLYWPGPAVYIPASAKIRFSADGVNYGSSMLRTLSTAEQNPVGAGPVSYNLLPSTGSGRYVELTLTRATRWIALSEVEFYGSATPVPEPSTYAMLLAGLGLVGFAARKRIG